MLMCICTHVRIYIGMVCPNTKVICACSIYGVIFVIIYYIFDAPPTVLITPIHRVKYQVSYIIWN